MSYKYRLVKDTVFQEIDGGGVLLNTSNGEYRQVNRTGSMVLGLICKGANTQMILDRMGETYPSVSNAELASDIEALLCELELAGVISRD